MDIRSLTVSLTPTQAAAMLKGQMKNVTLAYEERHSPMGGLEIIVQVYEKYFLRNNSHAGLTVTLQNFEGHTQVNAVATAGGQGLFNISWGACSNFAGYAERILDPYRIMG